MSAAQPLPARSMRSNGNVAARCFKAGPNAEDTTPYVQHTIDKICEQNEAVATNFLMAPSKMISSTAIESRIWFVRGQKVILDQDLAQLYSVPTKVFNQAVKRNRKRFPTDFMFRMTLEEARQFDSLRSQIVTLKRGQHRKYAPYVFTEQGIAMLSSVLNSDRAIAVNIAIIRTFVRLRQFLSAHEEVARRLDRVEAQQNEQGRNIRAVFETIQHLIEAPAEEQKRRIGFPTGRSGRSIQS